MLNLNCWPPSGSVSVNDDTMVPELVHVKDEMLPRGAVFLHKVGGRVGGFANSKEP